jgi:hypothetical protein
MVVEVEDKVNLFSVSITPASKLRVDVTEFVVKSVLGFPELHDL